MEGLPPYATEKNYIELKQMVAKLFIDIEIRCWLEIGNMNKQELIDNIIILVNRYVPNRDDLIELIKSDIADLLTSEVKKCIIWNFVYNTVFDFSF